MSAARPAAGQAPKTEPQAGCQTAAGRQCGEVGRCCCQARTAAGRAQQPKRWTLDEWASISGDTPWILGDPGVWDSAPGIQCQGYTIHCSTPKKCWTAGLRVGHRAEGMRACELEVADDEDAEVQDKPGKGERHDDDGSPVRAPQPAARGRAWEAAAQRPGPHSRCGNLDGCPAARCLTLCPLCALRPDSLSLPQFLQGVHSHGQRWHDSLAAQAAVHAARAVHAAAVAVARGCRLPASMHAAAGQEGRAPAQGAG